MLGLREEVVTMPLQVLSLLERGTKRRHVSDEYASRTLLPTPIFLTII